MEGRITPQWVAKLRRDLKAWDLRVAEAKKPWRPWERSDWLNSTPVLKYAGVSESAHLGPGGSQRQASTGKTSARGRYPPSKVYGMASKRRVAMRMRLPVHIWAMLSHGREAEQVTVEQVDRYGITVKGIGRRERWREHDGERHPAWSGEEPREWTAWVVRRMVWIKRIDGWYGHWLWEGYDHDKEWDDTCRRPRGPENYVLATSSAPWGTIPPEVLLGMLYMIKDDGDIKGLATACGVCRSWLALCAPTLNYDINVDSSRVKDLTEAVAQPVNNIAPYAQQLTIRGSVPWLALSKLLVMLPRLSKFDVTCATGVSHLPYYPLAPQLTSYMLTACRTGLTLTKLTLTRQLFTSAVDILRLCAPFPNLLTVELYKCAIRTASTTAPLVPGTHLKSFNIFGGRSVMHDGALSSLAQWWQWPHAATGPALVPYPGLHRADAHHVSSIIRCIALDAFPVEWRRVEIALRASWRTGTWVLVICILPPAVFFRCMELEFHVKLAPSEVSAESKPSARVEHIVLRLNTRGTRVPVTYNHLLRQMEEPMLQLASLRTVTLETVDAAGQAGLQNELVKLRARRMVRVRTCLEAEQVGKAAKHDPYNYLEAHGVVSPLWYWYSWTASHWSRAAYVEGWREREPSSVRLTEDAAFLPDAEDTPHSPR